MAEYEYLCLANLLGGTVPMNGQIPVSHGTTYQVEGGYGLYVDLAPINKAILRWSEGKFSQAERYFSKRWNEVINSVTLEAFENELESRRIITPSVNNLEDLGDAADDVLKTLALQHVFLKWMLKRLSIERELRNEIMARWSARKSPYLEDFAPYVFFCLRALLMLHLAVRNELVRWDSKNIVDLVYLFYAPFCDVFASDDKLHRRLAPHVLRDDQSFVRGSDLKKDLSRMIDEMEKMPDDVKRRISFALGLYPLPSTESVITDLWERQWGPWKRRDVSSTADLSVEEQELAFQEVEDLFVKAGRSVS